MDRPPGPLPKEKMKAVLEASVREFAEHGYAKASTNRITKGAGISKGLLFHYFGNKKNLYLYTLDACVENYLQYLSVHLKDLSPDLLERMLEISGIKIKMFMETPLMYRLVASAFTDPPWELKEEICARQNRIYSKQVPLILKDIDKSMFREDINHEKAIQLVLAAMEALSRRHTAAFRERADGGLAELPKIIDDLKEYVDILKYGIYTGRKRKELSLPE
ncbi:MAG: TetR/AcrR family transcriptional regulator [Peptococcaceae bacterium]|nr:TetR/AcrR family transcriptional regulator [Peptococcaceae bacterium]